MPNWIYADHNATTPVDPEVAEVMRPFYGPRFHNPSSMYDAALEAAQALKDARGEVAALLGGVAPDQILFTSGATEGNNAALRGVARAQPDRRHIITTAVEHPAVREVAREMEREGYAVTWLGVDRHGRLDPAALVKALRPDTLLVSIMHANNETGVVFPLSELARIVKETDPGILFHTDATQSAGKIEIDLRGVLRNVDLLSLSGHKLHASKGVGALFVRRGAPWRPWMLGGHQENGRRAGTENMAGIAGFGCACRLARANLGEGSERIRRLRDRLEQALLERIPWVEVNGAGAERLPNTLNLSCHYIEGEGILFQLNGERICASSGSACTSGSLEPSHVLRAMGVPFTAIHGSVRFSLGRGNTEAEIDRIIEVFPRIVASLRRMSPYWDEAGQAPRPNAPSVSRGDPP